MTGKKPEPQRASSPRGTYLLIADQLRESIERNPPKAGSLPSEAELSQIHEVSRNTIRRALKKLASEGLISAVAGTGWKVSSDSTSPLIDRITAVILADSLTVGSVFPSESKLCERFGASRTAVRRALALMEGRGLLVATPGKGRRVLALPEPTSRPYP